MPNQNKTIEEWRELMETFNQNGLDELPKLLGSQKEFEIACIPRQDSTEMLTQGESVITRKDIHTFDECPSGIYSKTNTCGENFLEGEFDKSILENYKQIVWQKYNPCNDSFLMQEETKEFNHSEQAFKAIFNLPTPKIIYLSDGKSIPKRKNRRK